MDLQAGDTAGSLSIDVANMVDYPVNGGESLTINLVDGYAVLGVSLSLDSTNEDYSTYAGDTGDLSAQDNIISDKINSVVKKYTVQEMIDNEEGVKEEILEELQTLYKSSFIVRVNFSSATYQKQ